MKTTAKMKDPTKVAFKQIYATKLKEQFFKTCVYIYTCVYMYTDLITVCSIVKKSYLNLSNGIFFGSLP